jgi:gamma-glutamylcyclotransferase (GGCT)/AIG2-like uncharacterized protein YtfP
MSEALFVYGTLRPGARNWAVIEDCVESTVRASLDDYSMWRLPDGYPGVRPCLGSRVVGDLLFARPGSGLLDEGDRLEGFEPNFPDAPETLFQRARVIVRTSTGSKVTSWVYIYAEHRDPYIRSHGTLIEEGDWINSSQ